MQLRFYFRETKIVVKGDNTSQLLALAAKANTIDIPNYLVQDAGRTQVSLIMRRLVFNATFNNISVIL